MQSKGKSIDLGEYNLAKGTFAKIRNINKELRYLGANGSAIRQVSKEQSGKGCVRATHVTRVSCCDINQLIPRGKDVGLGERGRGGGEGVLPIQKTCDGSIASPLIRFPTNRFI